MDSSSHCSGNCCSSTYNHFKVLSLKGLGDAANDTKYGDIERGPPAFERIILRIDGLKCGCCEGGISRAVSRIYPIKNHQVNIVLARLEFDLDTSRMSIAEVIKRLNAKTGYSFEQQFVSAGQVLEFVFADTGRIKDAGLPYGVLRVEPPDKDSWRYLYTLSGRNSAMSIEKKSPAKITAEKRSSNDSGSTVDCTPTRIRSQPTKIFYDTSIIGAQDIFDYYRRFDHTLHLAPPSAHPSLASGAKQARRALCLLLPTLALTIPVLVIAWAPINHAKLIYAHISLGLASAVQVIALKEFVPNAARSLYHSYMFDMDFLVALSTTTAYIFSVVSYVHQMRAQPLETGSFFETSTLLVSLILLGRVINEFARYRAAKAVSFRALQLDEALLVVPDSIASIDPDPRTRKIDARLLQYGDHFKVPPHTRVVTDGVVVCGGSEIDESMVTGESIPVAKGVHSKVIAGTNNGSGTLIVKLTALPHENSVHRIAAMVEDAELTKPKAQAIADGVAAWFVPAIAGIGIVVFLVWYLVERYHIKHSWKNAMVTAVTYAVATLVVSCPCAIGLAVPMVVLIAGGVAARFGIIFRDPKKLEVARNVTDVIFDKTGTLTCGVPTVWEVDYHGTDPVSVKGMLLSLLKDIDHPVSASVLRYLEREIHGLRVSVQPTEVTDIISTPGEGVKGICTKTGLEIRAGHPDWLGVHVAKQSSTLLCVKMGDILLATFKLIDRPRHTAEKVIQKLQARGIETHMISGDNKGAVDDIASSLNISKRNTQARCKPEEKMDYIKDLQRPGKVVMFVGDGTNDAAALKQADIGVHLNQGSDVAKSAADVVLMTTRLHDILILLDISRAAYRRIILNFTWSAVYNIFAILLAAGAFVKAGKQIRVHPQWAGLGELVSVLPVVLIAFQMRWCNYGKQYRTIEYDYTRSEASERGARVGRKAAASSEEAGCCVMSPSKLKAMRQWRNWETDPEEW